MAAGAQPWPGANNATVISANVSTPANLKTVRGVVRSVKKAFFDDPDVKRVFALSGLSVDVQTAGSREIATSVDLKNYDFAFPSSAPAAEKIKREHKPLEAYSPFYSPIAIATFTPIVGVLESAGVAKKAPTGYWTFDIAAYLKLVAKGTRWNQIPGQHRAPGQQGLAAHQHRCPPVQFRRDVPRGGELCRKRQQHRGLDAGNR